MSAPRDYIQEAVDIMWHQIDMPTDKVYEWPPSVAEAYRELRFEAGREAARKELARLIAIDLQNAGLLKNYWTDALENDGEQ